MKNNRCLSLPRRNFSLLLKLVCASIFMVVTLSLLARHSSVSTNQTPSSRPHPVEAAVAAAAAVSNPAVYTDMASAAVVANPIELPLPVESSDHDNSSGSWHRPLPKRYSRKQFVSSSGGGLASVTSVASAAEHVDRVGQFSDGVRARLDREIDQDLHLIDPALGQGGEPAVLGGARLQALAAKLMKVEAFNVMVSDRMSPNRTVPDTRSHRCLSRNYDLASLPSASVIIIFTNEAYSALVRTIHSVINTSPPSLLYEIILVDDFSDRAELGAKLERYIERFFNGPAEAAAAAAAPEDRTAGARGGRQLVRLVRLRRRSGLIRARLTGARLAGADVLVFLDSHCECGPHWLEPLLARIGENRTAVLTPIIDVIDDKTLEYHHSNGEFFQVGGFTWSGHFKWINVPQDEIERRGSPANPTRSPTMAGGLFAIDRDYFWESGSYDENMDVWGGENLEMSFRIWMCGGTIETVPCSRVGHIFRDFHPYTFPGNKDTHGINTARVVEVWMDDYKRLFYMHRPDLKGADIGSIESRLQFRRRSQCHSFRWYLHNVLPQMFIPDENVVGFGKVVSDFVRPPLCLDNLQRKEDDVYDLGVYLCHNYLASSQMFSLTRSGQLRREETCAIVVVRSSRQSRKLGSRLTPSVQMSKCDDSPLGRWQYSQGMLRHVDSGLCLERAGLASGDNVTLSTCSGSASQRWRFDRS